MVQVRSMLAAGDVRLATSALQPFPPVPTSTAWIAHVRPHDDIGWAVGDEDAVAAGLDGHAHRSFLSGWCSGAFPGSSATGLVSQEDSATAGRVPERGGDGQLRLPPYGVVCSSPTAAEAFLVAAAPQRISPVRGRPKRS